MLEIFNKVHRKGFRGLATALHNRILMFFWRLPLTVEAYWWFIDRKERRLLGKSTRAAGPIGAQFQSWLEEVEQPLSSNRQATSRFLCFGFDDWLPYNLALSLTLIGFGCHVGFSWLHSNYTFYGRSFSERTKYQRVLRYLAELQCPGLSLIPLLSVSPTELPEDVLNQVYRQTFLDVQYIMQIEEIDMKSNPYQRSKYEARLQRNLRFSSAFITLLKQGHYDTILMPSGMVLEYGMAYRLAKLYGVRSVSYESHFKPGNIIVSNHAPAIALDTTNEWHRDMPHILSPERRKRVLDFLKVREKPSTISRPGLYQIAPKSKPSELFVRLGLSPDRPIALLCTNVFGDGAVLDRDLAFRSMIDWIRKTIECFVKHPNYQLIVRVHPAEFRLRPEQQVKTAVRTSFSALPDHIHIIESQDLINTYSLMDLSTLGLVYTSTTGIEMAMRGIPVVTVARTHYRGKGFTIDSDTQSQYFEIIEMWRNDPDKLATTQRQVELAWCYFDMYMFQFPKPFPWKLASFSEDISLWPISRVLNETIGSPFQSTWELIMGQPILKQEEAY